MGRKLCSFFNAFPCGLLSEWDHWWSWAFSHDLIDEERTAQLKLTEYIGGNWLKAYRLLSKWAVLVKAHHAAEKYYVCIFLSWGIIKKFHIERNKLWFGVEKKNFFLGKMQEVNSVSCRCKSGQILKPFVTQREVTNQICGERQTKTKRLHFLWFFPLLLLGLHLPVPNTTFQTLQEIRDTELLSTSLPSFKKWIIRAEFQNLVNREIWERKHPLWHIGGSLQDCEVSYRRIFTSRSLIWPFCNAWTNSAVWRQEVFSSAGSHSLEWIRR